MISMLPKLAVVISTGYAFVQLAHWPLGFTFFTQLSNLYAALIVLAQLTPRFRNKLAAAKYTATVSVTITFLVYLTVLAPMTPGGMLAAYAEDHYASLALHIVSPLFCLADFLLNDAPARPWRRANLGLALIPPVAWLLMILVLGQCGVRWRDMVAPYPFLNYAAPTGWFGFAPETADTSSLGIGVFYAVCAMLVVCLAVSSLLLALARKRHRMNRDCSTLRINGDGQERE